MHDMMGFDHSDKLKQPKDKSFSDWLESRVARFETRTYDWDALKFQADYDPKYARAQCRYIGTGGTGVSHDDNVVPAEHFTFSTMILPAGCEGPPHIHVDVEEVFFMLKGSIRLTIEDDDDFYETILKERDLASVPPGYYRGLYNIGQEEALMLVMLGSDKPVTPSYPPDHPLSKIKRQSYALPAPTYCPTSQKQRRQTTPLFPNRNAVLVIPDDSRR